MVEPGDHVYEGQIVGENSNENDLDVNVTKDPTPDPVLHAIGEHHVRLMPSRSMSLEQALEFIRDDELVEVTPRALRLRKKILPVSLRARKS